LFSIPNIVTIFKRKETLSFRYNFLSAAKFTGQPHEKTEEICYNLPKGDGQL